MTKASGHNLIETWDEDDCEKNLIRPSFGGQNSHHLFRRNKTYAFALFCWGLNCVL